ncbi:hypothetical protein O181_028371 [Austropuccinia psidii MF-1]|uniref:Magnesium transporter NIPA2 n=1 Tax=Austropuccinia psidii MF-1 TaxID=1389203 RepID=A0A9Q3CP08_9BASI|nr:hypothetical protein [Austropuccinia psidii MF-1]
MSSSSPTVTQALDSIKASAAALASSQAALASASASLINSSSSGSLIDQNSSPAYFKIIGIVLALVSGLFIGSSFVFKKKGLLISQQKVLNKGGEIGESHGYLKSPMWWCGMLLMVVGEICNFVAYAFADAILVTPMGALSVVISAVLSSIFLKERLSFFGKIGCFLCILGATIIALNGPQDQAVSSIPQFEKLFLAPGFLVFASVILISALALIFFVAPKWGKTNMLVYITICSIIGGLSVVSTQGLGSSILTTIRGENQFKYWFMYFLLGFVICTLLTEINYLNKALELFNTAMVTPTYYVMFTFSTLVTSIILFQGLKAPALSIVTLVLGFLVICSGITLLQMSKVDPLELTGLDRRSSVLLAADKEPDDESGLAAEDPGMDGLRGFGGLVGTIQRNSLIARRSTASSLVALSERSITRRRRQEDFLRGTLYSNQNNRLNVLQRHSLWDKPISDHSQEVVKGDFSSQTNSTGQDMRLNVLGQIPPRFTGDPQGSVGQTLEHSSHSSLQSTSSFQGQKRGTMQSTTIASELTTEPQQYSHHHALPSRFENHQIKENLDFETQTFNPHGGRLVESHDEARQSKRISATAIASLLSSSSPPVRSRQLTTNPLNKLKGSSVISQFNPMGGNHGKRSGSRDHPSKSRDWSQHGIRKSNSKDDKAEMESLVWRGSLNGSESEESIFQDETQKVKKENSYHIALRAGNNNCNENHDHDQGQESEGSDKLRIVVDPGAGLKEGFMMKMMRKNKKTSDEDQIDSSHSDGIEEDEEESGNDSHNLCISRSSILQI